MKEREKITVENRLGDEVFFLYCPDDTHDNGEPISCIPIGELDDVSGGTSKTNREQYSGIVVEALVCTLFKVLLDNGSTVTAYMSGMMRCNNTRVLVGDRVTVEISPYDPTRGRIISCEK